jgi:hypothetical protein
MKTKKPKLWIRKLDCGHSRYTTIRYLIEEYSKPKIGEKCYCRECFKYSKVIGVEEVKNEEIEKGLKTEVRIYLKKEKEDENKN